MSTLGSVRCDCGCGLGHDEDAFDDVTDWCIAEAAHLFYEELQARELEEPAAPVKPGTITDPVMQDAMARVQQAHRQNFGGVEGMHRGGVS